MVRQEILPIDESRFLRCFKSYSDAGLGKPSTQYVRTMTGLNNKSICMLSKKFDLAPYDLNRKNKDEVNGWCVRITM